MVNGSVSVFDGFAQIMVIGVALVDGAEQLAGFFLGIFGLIDQLVQLFLGAAAEFITVGLGFVDNFTEFGVQLFEVALGFSQTLISSLLDVLAGVFTAFRCRQQTGQVAGGGGDGTADSQ